MKPVELLEILHTAERLKDVTRHSYTSGGRHESVAEHSWRITLMAFLLRDEFPELDMDKVLRMCLIHDLGECFTGDIPAFDKTADDSAREEELPLVFYLFTDVKSSSSEILWYGEGAESIVARAFDVEPHDGMALLPGVVSRKKQVIPALMATLQSIQEDQD